MYKRWLSFGVSLFAACVLTAAARADMVSFDLDLGNSAISGYSGPYATINVDRTSATTAKITFTSLTNSGNIYLMGANSAVAVNVNASSWTLGALTASNSGTGFTPGPLNDGGGLNVSSFGVFNQTIDSVGGFTNSSDVISFILNNTSGTWADAASVLAGNASGYLAAAHIFVTGSPANASNGALESGYAANGVSQVPLPGALPLFGTGLAALGLLGWRRKRKHVAA